MNPKLLSPHAEIKSITGKHHAGWSWRRHEEDGDGYHARPINKGRHIAPVAQKVGKHHPATPGIYNQAGNVVPLFPTATVLDVAA